VSDVPHRVLVDYYADESQRRAFVVDLFDRTSQHYDGVERLLALGSGSRYRRQSLVRAGLSAGMSIVDVGVGTGLLARQAKIIVGDTGRVVGVDPSAGMMAQADLPREIELLTGTAEAIPTPDLGFDFLSMGFALRHLSSLSVAFAEFHRVLRPGGKVCLLEITRPAGSVSRWLLKAYMRAVVPAIARLWTRDARTARFWRYYWDTIEFCVEPAVVMQALAAAGFVDVERHVELGIFSEYRGRRPAN
jgi:demethylmenaquinone methyltransferase / 2-methoxy-6-polyprenyl-1,4-benzoquinol methylase